MRMDYLAQDTSFFLMDFHIIKLVEMCTTNQDNKSESNSEGVLFM